MQAVRWVVCVSALTALLLMSNHPTTAASSSDAMGHLDAFITKAVKEYKVPGAAVAVVQDGKVILAKGYGVRDVTKANAVDEDTIFPLASVTKTFTGAAAATVVDEENQRSAPIQKTNISSPR